LRAEAAVCCAPAAEVLVAVPAGSFVSLAILSAEGKSTPGLETLVEPLEGAGTRWEELGVVPGTLTVGTLTGAAWGAGEVSTGA
jgi:hypothetical protein